MGCVEAAGVSELQVLTLIDGRPLALAVVMPMRGVASLTWVLVRVKRTTWPLFTSRQRYAGKAVSAELPTVKAPGDQLARRTSDGCIVVTWAPLRSSVGAPSQRPMRQSAGVASGSPSMAMVFKEAVLPAVTCTPVL